MKKLILFLCVGYTTISVDVLGIVPPLIDSISVADVPPDFLAVPSYLPSDDPFRGPTGVPDFNPLDTICFSSTCGSIGGGSGVGAPNGTPYATGIERGATGSLVNVHVTVPEMPVR